MPARLYIVEYTEPGKDPVSLVLKVDPAYKLVRKLVLMGISHSLSEMDGLQLSTSREIEDLIDQLEARYPIKKKETAE